MFIIDVMAFLVISIAATISERVFICKKSLKIGYITQAWMCYFGPLFVTFLVISIAAVISVNEFILYLQEGGLISQFTPDKPGRFTFPAFFFKVQSFISI